MEKTGRNDPCPCGSGKKYKKCCEAKLSRKTAMSDRKIEDQTRTSGFSHLFKSLIHPMPKVPSPEVPSQEAPPPEAPPPDSEPPQEKP